MLRKVREMDKFRILETMAGLQANAENEEAGLEDFLPLRNYALLGEPNKFLILGGRGAGKTRVFRTLLEEDGFSQVIGNQLNLFKPNAGNTEFIMGYYHEDNRFPSQNVLAPYANDHDAVSFWVGCVVILLCEHFKDDKNVQGMAQEYFSTEFTDLLKNSKTIKNPSRWISYFDKNPESWENFLDDLDEYLEAQDKWIFLTYDTMDRLCPKYADLFPFIRALLSFWFAHLRRWNRIKSKIFLRNDLFDSELLSFPDSSKLGSNYIKLEWNTVSLYRLLIKRLANAGNEDMILYLKKMKGLLNDKKDAKLGYIPTENEELIKGFVNEMIGKYMGANAKKGVSYTWVPNHLQDTHGVLAPRSFLKCYIVAAGKMLEKPEEVEKLAMDRLLHPSMIQGAMQEVSEDRVRELQEEYPWLEQLKRAFAGTAMLMGKNEFIQKIRMDLWKPEEQEKLPATTPLGIFEALQKLGIVFVAKDGRVNVPEIYLHGFGMKRKGGLRRPN